LRHRIDTSSQTKKLKTLEAYADIARKESVEKDIMAGLSPSTVTLDDDPSIGSLIQKYSGIPTNYFSCTQALLPEVSKLKPLAAFIDINLGLSESGLAMIPNLKKQWPYCPIIVITSELDGEIISEAIAAGADDFIRKPINKSELQSRMQARLRDMADKEKKKSFRVGDLSIDTLQGTVGSHGKSFPLTPTSLKLFLALIEQKGTISSHAYLKRRVWGKFVVTDNALDRKIHELRDALEGLGSSVQLKNVYGKGFTLEGIVQKSEFKEPVTSRTESQEPVIETEGTLKILLLEDTESDAAIVQRHLKANFTSKGHTLIWKQTLKAALEELERGGFDIILSDLQLPDCDGLMSYREILRLAPNIPVVVLSGSDHNGVARQAVSLGAQDFISKNSLSADLLEKTIQYAIARHRLKMLSVVSALREREEALKLSKLKSLFLSTMSHEIRTPMNAVIGTTSLLLRTDLSTEQMEYVDTIRTSGKTLINLINDILDYSKIEAGKFELECTSFSLRNVIEETIDLFSEAAIKKNLVLVGITDPKVPQSLEGDAIRIGQILNNLVSNAIKFTHTGKIELRASVLSADKNSARIKFQVRDTGQGMGLEFQKRLFEAFSQESNDTTRSHEGTGLGLSICQKLVGIMGGAIQCTTELGRGSEFEWEIEFNTGNALPFKPRGEISGSRIGIYSKNLVLVETLSEQIRSRGLLPIELPELSDVTSAKISCLIADDLNGKYPPEHFEGVSVPTMILRAKGSPAIQFPIERSSILCFPFRQSRFYQVLSDLLTNQNHVLCKEKCNRQLIAQEFQERRLKPILVVEDNPVNQKVVSRMLEKMGFTVDAVSDGKHAVEAISLGNYGLVLMDCLMPTMDGFEATQKLRALGHKNLPIVALTANAFAEDKARCFESGMNDYLAKPIQWELLEEMLVKWMKVDSVKPVIEPLLDPKVLKTLEELNTPEDPDFLGGMFGLFVENAGPTMKELKVQLSNRNADGIRRMAHRLKGFGVNLGAKRLIAACQVVEEAGAKKFLEQIEEKCKNVEIELENVTTFIAEAKAKKAS